jgi:hypothetical protein
LSDDAGVGPADSEPTTAAPAVTRPPTAGRPLLALILFLAVVVLDLVAGPALRPTPSAHHGTDVLAIAGGAALVGAAGVDPTELAQVAARQHPPVPLAMPAEALLDALLLISATAVALPPLASRRDVARGIRFGVFAGSVSVLVGATAVGVAAIARLRYLVALYLSPPYGTLSYLLLSGSSPTVASLVVLSVVQALRVGACVAFFRTVPRMAQRGTAPLALTSVAAAGLTALCYAWVPSSLTSITGALAAAVTALAAVLWAAVMLSGSVRRLA